MSKKKDMNDKKKSEARFDTAEKQLKPEQRMAKCLRDVGREGHMIALCVLHSHAGRRLCVTIPGGQQMLWFDL